jgi:hypothetical protein
LILTTEENNNNFSNYYHLLAKKNIENVETGKYILRKDKLYSTEPEFVNVSGAQESIPPAYVVWRAGTSN